MITQGFDSQSKTPTSLLFSMSSEDFQMFALYCTSLCSARKCERGRHCSYAYRTHSASGDVAIGPLGQQVAETQHQREWEFMGYLLAPSGRIGISCQKQWNQEPTLRALLCPWPLTFMCLLPSHLPAHPPENRLAPRSIW